MYPLFSVCLLLISRGVLFYRGKELADGGGVRVERARATRRGMDLCGTREVEDLRSIERIDARAREDSDSSLRKEHELLDERSTEESRVCLP